MSVTLSKLSVKQQFNLDKMLKNKKFLHHSIKTYQDKSLKVLKEGLLRSNAKYKVIIFIIYFLLVVQISYLGFYNRNI